MPSRKRSAAGAVSGGSLYLDSHGKAGLTALTGQTISQYVSTVVGAAAGLCAGLAGGVNRKNPSKG